MATVPVGKLTKKELQWMANHRCQHGHSFLSHYNCYLREFPNGSDNIKIGFYDIETSNLKANMGIILSWAIKPLDEDPIYDIVTKKDLLSDGMDKRVVSSLVKEMKKYDMLVGYFNSRYDTPFVRTRAVHHDIDFPCYGELSELDLFYIVRSKFNLTRKSLKVACNFLLGDDNKTEVSYKHWMKAAMGDKESLDYVLEHNIYDVIDTERLYKKVVPFKKVTQKSI